jgi:hypothetical protein
MFQSRTDRNFLEFRLEETKIERHVANVLVGIRSQTLCSRKCTKDERVRNLVRLFKDDDVAICMDMATPGELFIVVSNVRASVRIYYKPKISLTKNLFLVI